jgi:hypothetical protein
MEAMRMEALPQLTQKKEALAKTIKQNLRALKKENRVVKRLKIEIDFKKARVKAFCFGILSILLKRQSELLPFDEVAQKLKPYNQFYKGTEKVELNKIIGSLDRYRDFDRTFLPTKSYTKDKWQSVDLAYIDSTPLLPVELYKVGNAYFVRDGHHRISVARERGVKKTDALVTELKTPNNIFEF